MAQPPEFGRTRGPLPEVHDEALQGTRPWPRLDYHVLYSYDSGHTRSEHEDGRPQQIPKSCSKMARNQRLSGFLGAATDAQGLQEKLRGGHHAPQHL